MMLSFRAGAVGVALVAALLTVPLVVPAAAVVGGDRATPGLHPQLVSLEVDGEHQCGGNLVDKNTVLTSAHCVVVDEKTRQAMRPERLRILAGTYRRSSGGQRVAVSSVEVHAGFGSPQARSNDVALLHLAATPRSARPVRLARPEQQATLWAPGRQALVAGWGVTSTTGDTPEDDLREAAVPLRSAETCAQRYPVAVPTSAAFDRATNICAGDDLGGRDACSFDSGSALTVAGSRGERLLVGLPSFGLLCATPGFPGAYAGVALPALHQWITARLDRSAPQ